VDTGSKKKSIFAANIIYIIMKKFFLISLLIAFIVSCSDNKINLPSGSPKNILSENLYKEIQKRYEQIDSFQFGYAIVKNQKYGLLSYEGEEVLPCIYDTIITFNNDAKIIQKDNKYGVVKYNGEEITKLEYDDFKDSSSFLAYHKNNQIIALKKNNLWGAILPNDKEIIPFKYNDITHIELGYVVVEQNNKFGIIDSLGNIKIEVDYDTIFFNYENSNISLAQKNNCIGIINSQCQLVTKCEYNCEYLLDGALPMQVPPSNGYIKLQKFQADQSQPIISGMINCETGEIAIPFKYDDLGSYSEGLVWAKKGEKYGYLDINNNVVLKFQYERAYDFSEGFAAVEKYTGKLINLRMGLVPDRKTGFIDKYGKVVIPYKYNTQIGNQPIFKEGLAPITISNESFYGRYKGYINKHGDFVVKPIYEEATPIEKGVGIVTLNDKKGCIDKNGKLIIPVEYSSITIGDKTIIAEQNEKGVDYKYTFSKTGKLLSKVK